MHTSFIASFALSLLHLAKYHTHHWLGSDISGYTIAPESTNKTDRSRLYGDSSFLSHMWVSIYKAHTHVQQ